MIIHGRDAAATSLPGVDVLVVGAGAAGIPASIELELAGVSVLLVESGPLRGNDPAADDLSRGDVVNDQHGPLHRYRRRAFGGTTSVWGGRAAPLDEIDFESRPYVAGSGWPIGLSDLEPHYARAHRYLRLGEFAYDASDVVGSPARGQDPGLESFDDHMLWRFSEPTDLGRTWRRHIARSRLITLVTGVTATEMHLTDDGSQVESVTLRAAGGGAQQVRATAVILAGGGLECTRLLLHSRHRSHPDGLGNASGALGRYYTSHLAGTIGPFTWMGSPTLPGLRYERDRDGVYVRRTLSLRPQVQRDRGLLNFRAAVSVPSLSDPSHGSAVLSSAFLAKRFLLGRIPPEFDAKYAGDHAVQVRNRHLVNVVKGAPELAAFGPWWLRKRIVPKRKIPSMEPRITGSFHLHFDAEQTPLAASRVTLGEEHDALGVPRLRVDWRVRDGDIQSMAESYDLLRHELKAADIADAAEPRDALAERVSGELGVGSHHIGTTRMSVSPRDGVVDTACRVHGVSNLFIASASVFPTPGVANPTLTIIAVAVRVARHVRAELGRA